MMCSFTTVYLRLCTYLLVTTTWSVKLLPLHDFTGVSVPRKLLIKMWRPGNLFLAIAVLGHGNHRHVALAFHREP